MAKLLHHGDIVGSTSNIASAIKYKNTTVESALDSLKNKAYISQNNDTLRLQLDADESVNVWKNTNGVWSVKENLNTYSSVALSPLITTSRCDDFSVSKVGKVGQVTIRNLALSSALTADTAIGQLPNGYKNQKWVGFIGNNLSGALVMGFINNGYVYLAKGTGTALIYATFTYLIV